jgi:group I intron endonuclease
MKMNLKGSSGFIYLITNKIDGGIYVGQTVNVRKRWNEHKNNLRNGWHSNPILQNAWVKYGESAFEFKIAEEVTTDLVVSEQFWIDAYRAAGIRIYNIAEPSEPPMLGRNHTEETRKKMSLSQMDREFSLEHRVRLSESQIGNKKALGHIHTEESKAKMSEAALGNQRFLGRKHSPETLARMSEAQKKSWLLRKSK